MALARADPPAHTSTVIESTTVESFDLIVRRLKALADPTRLRILHVLADGRRCVCEIQGRVDVAANLLSHHLKVLREAGLVTAQRRGRWIDYELDDAALDSLAAALPGSAHGNAARAGAGTAPCACGATGPVRSRS